MSKTKVTINKKQTLTALIAQNYDINIFECPYFTHIAHISDIHICPLKRHDEYLYVFNLLYSELIALRNKLDNKLLIVLTGDLFDDKHNFKPETFHLSRSFLKSLSSIAHVCLIAGNHDMLENNLGRLDAISPIVDGIQNLTYFCSSGLYKPSNNDFLFVVSSLYDKVFIPHCKQYNQYKQIALYHGAIISAKTDYGHTISNDIGGTSTRYRTLSEFNEFHAVLLGDIHKFQKFNDNMCYAGSLIQQNHGESTDGHGYVLWDFSNDLSPVISHKSIQNSWAHITIDIRCGKIVKCPNFTAKNVYLRVIHDNTHRTDIDHIIKEFITKHELIVHKLDQHTIAENINTTEIPIEIIEREDDRILIKSELTGQSQDIVEKVLQIHNEFCMEHKKTVSTEIWRPVWMEFSNLFGYHGNKKHHIDFNNGIIGIHGRNHTGKTSIANTLMFGLYGKTPLSASSRTHSYDVVNNKESSGYVNVLINHGSKYYLIQRKTIKKQPRNQSAYLSLLNSHSFTLEIHETDENGKILQNIANCRKGTSDTVLEELIGKIDTFIETNLVSSASTSILNKTNTECLSTLKTIFGLSVFDYYKKLNAEKLKHIETQLSDLSSKSSALKNIILDSANTDINLLISEKGKINQSLIEDTEKRKCIETRLDDLISKHLSLSAKLEKIIIDPQERSVTNFDPQINIDVYKNIILANNKRIHQLKELLGNNVSNITIDKQYSELEKNQLAKTAGMLQTKINNLQERYNKITVHEDLRDSEDLPDSLEDLDKEKLLLTNQLIQIGQRDISYNGPYNDIEWLQSKIEKVYYEPSNDDTYADADADSDSDVVNPRICIPTYAETIRNLHDKIIIINKQLVDQSNLPDRTQLEKILNEFLPLSNSELDLLKNKLAVLENKSNNIVSSDIDQTELENLISKITESVTPKKTIYMTFTDAKNNISLLPEDMTTDTHAALTQTEKLVLQHQYMSKMSDLESKRDKTALDYSINDLAHLEEQIVNIGEIPEKKQILPQSTRDKLQTELVESANILTKLKTSIDSSKVRYTIGYLKDAINQGNDICALSKHDVETIINLLESLLCGHEIKIQIEEIETRVNEIKNKLTIDTQNLEHNYLVDELLQKKQNNGRLHRIINNINYNHVQQELNKVKLSFLQSEIANHKHNMEVDKLVADLEYYNNLKISREILKLRDQLTNHLAYVNAEKKLSIYLLNDKLLSEKELVTIEIEEKTHKLLQQQKYNRHIYYQNIKYTKIINQLKHTEISKKLNVINCKLKKIIGYEIQRNFRELEQINKLLTDISSNELTLLELDNTRKLADIKTQFMFNNGQYQRINNDIFVCISEITDLQRELTLLTEKIEINTKLETSLQIDISKAIQSEKVKYEIDSLTAKITELNKIKQYHTIYRNLVDSKGIPFKLLQHKINALQSDINQIVSRFTKYDVLIIHDENKQTIDFITVDKKSKSHLSTARMSGYEKVMIEIAVKRALNRHSFNSKCSIMVIDEGFDVIDSTKFGVNSASSELENFVTALTENYTTCILISQRDTRHIVDHIIQIDIIDNVPVITQKPFKY